jgi:hypothetical protein
MADLLPERGHGRGGAEASSRRYDAVVAALSSKRCYDEKRTQRTVEADPHGRVRLEVGAIDPPRPRERTRPGRPGSADHALYNRRRE